MAMHDNNVGVCCAGDEPRGSSHVSRSGVCLCSQRKLWLPGGSCTSAQWEGNLLYRQMLVFNTAVGQFLTFYPLCYFHRLEGAGGRQQQPQEESIPRVQCWVSAEVSGKLGSNIITSNIGNSWIMWFASPTTGGTSNETVCCLLSRLIPGAHVVKAFNTLSAWSLQNGPSDANRQVVNVMWCCFQLIC